MPQVNVRVNFGGEALRHTRVQLMSFGLPIGEYITDDNGDITDNQGNLGIESPLFPTVDIRIVCQNPVAKVLDGNAFPFPASVHFDANGVGDSETVNVADPGGHFAVLTMCLNTYESTFIHLSPFRNVVDPVFPFGRENDLGATFDRKKRIEVSFPDQSPPPGGLSFTEPKSLATGFPLIHLRGPAANQATVSSEVAHGLHFTLLTESIRQQIQNDYLGWLITQTVTGARPFHDLNIETIPLVAFIEAFDHFSRRFTRYVALARAGSLVSPDQGFFLEIEGARARMIPSDIQDQINMFIRTQPALAPSIDPDASIDELIDGFTRLELNPLNNRIGSPIGTLQANGTVVPHRTTLSRLNANGTSLEGAIYGALYLDLARRVGLSTVMGSIIESQAIEFGGYRQFIQQNRQDLVSDLQAVASTWQLGTGS